MASHRHRKEDVSEEQLSQDVAMFDRFNMNSDQEHLSSAPDTDCYIPEKPAPEPKKKWYFR
jgi:hypothetical protein